jgi:hypothetical protein
LAFLCPRNKKRSSPKIETLFIGAPEKEKEKENQKKGAKKVKKKKSGRYTRGNHVRTCHF